MALSEAKGGCLVCQGVEAASPVDAAQGNLTILAHFTSRTTVYSRRSLTARASTIYARTDTVRHGAVGTF